MLVDLLHDERLELGHDGAADVPLTGYGYCWLRVVRPGERRLL